MIVKCKAIYNEYTKKYVDFEAGNNLIVGFHYNVLEMRFDNDISFRINTDRDGLASCSIVVLAKDFEIITSNIPSNWIFDRDGAILSPKKWREMDIWEESFWQDYIEDRPKALACYRDEIKTIVAADKDYIQAMIDERADRDIFSTWQDTMLPLFAEVLKGKY